MVSDNAREGAKKSAKNAGKDDVNKVFEGKNNLDERIRLKTIFVANFFIFTLLFQKLMITLNVPQWRRDDPPGPIFIFILVICNILSPAHPPCGGGRQWYFLQ